MNFLCNRFRSTKIKLLSYYDDKWHRIRASSRIRKAKKWTVDRPTCRYLAMRYTCETTYSIARYDIKAQVELIYHSFSKGYDNIIVLVVFSSQCI